MLHVCIALEVDKMSDNFRLRPLCTPGKESQGRLDEPQKLYCFCRELNSDTSVVQLVLTELFRDGPVAGALSTGTYRAQSCTCPALLRVCLKGTR